jgi:N6-adenosine-specific RNA methylase IME4
MSQQLKLHDIPHRYDLILCDPPWSYNSRCHHSKTRFGGGVHAHYPVMTDSEIRAMPVVDLAEKNSLLFMWATGPRLDLALDVMRCWQFKFVNVVFTWMKLNRSGKGLFFGVGYYAKSNAEFCLLGKRGRGLKPAVNDVSSAVLTPRQEHSRKPTEVHRRIERMFPSASKLELFARRPVEGWSVFGNQVESDITITIPTGAL